MKRLSCNLGLLQLLRITNYRSKLRKQVRLLNFPCHWVRDERRGNEIAEKNFEERYAQVLTINDIFPVVRILS